MEQSDCCLPKALLKWEPNEFEGIHICAPTKLSATTTGAICELRKMSASVQVVLIIAGAFCFKELCTMMTILVNNYFDTFRVCWAETLHALQAMIIAYLEFLAHLVDRLTQSPACLYFCILAAVLMLFVTIIIRVVVPWGGHKVKSREKQEQHIKV